ncbi:MAG: hypothetical protein JNJ90_13665 [Saprospiraceae bacterium]|jgi:hypothetical protein|nr:hypothetical protein [Saprospiraceae bacterium]
MTFFRTLFLLAALGAPYLIAAQKHDKAAIKAAINQFFEGMAKGDSTLLLGACTEAPVLQTISVDKQGAVQVRDEDFREFVRHVTTPSKNTLDERIEFAAIHAEELLASVWTPYKFYLNGKLSHCGTNSFQLVKTGAGWKIQYIIDTRRKMCK